MDISNYISQKKSDYTLLLEIIDDENDSDEEYQKLFNIYDSKQDKKEEIREFLYSILKISNNRHESPNFRQKIGKIFTIFKDVIKQTFSNSELFDLFKNNRRILLFLLKEKMIKTDESVIQYVLKRKDRNGVKYCHFFYPEIKSMIDEKDQQEIENEMILINPDIFSNFEEKREKGQNDSLICEMIRNYSVNEFISYFARTDQSFSSYILPSLFETNSFLIKNKTSLIEYAAFFGSIRIIKFLRLNNVESKSSLWLYAIHSNNAELIHILEENDVEPPNGSYNKCLEEAIKCHHNEIANYILNNLIDESNENKYSQNIACYCFHYYNFNLLSDKINQNFLFGYACQFNYVNLVNLFLKTGKIDLNEKIVFYFFNIQMIFQL